MRRAAARLWWQQQLPPAHAASAWGGGAPHGSWPAATAAVRAAAAAAAGSGPPAVGRLPLWGTAAAAAGARRGLAAGLKDVSPQTLAKARRLALAVGAAAGAFGSVVGVGGGVLIVPAIVNACPSIPQRVISGTSLAAVVATGATAGCVYLGSGLVDPTSAALIAAGAVVTAPLGARCASRLDCGALRRALGWWLVAVAPLVPAKALLFARAEEGGASGGGNGGGAVDHHQQQQQQLQTQQDEQQHHHQQPLMRPLRAADAVVAATGCLAGFASGLLGIGGGTVVTPALAVLTGLPQASVLGTSLAAMVAPSLAGLAQHARLGNVDWRMGAALAAGTAAGSFAGSHAALAAPPGALEAVFAAGMLFLGRKTLQAAAKAAALKAKGG